MHHSQKQYKGLYFIAALIAAAVSVFLIELGGVGDSDYYWHIVLGREICSTHTIPVTDTFSWLSQDLGLTETAHSWLSSIILYQFSRISSNPMVGLLFYSFITAFLYALFVEFAWAKKLRDPLENCLFVTIVTALLSWSGRPQTIGMILFVVSFYLLNDFYRNPDSKRCWLLPILSFLWANLHGGSLPILFAFSALYILMCYLPNINTFGLVNEKELETKKVRTYIRILVASLLTGLINPYTYKLYYYFFVTNNEATKKYVLEWQPCLLSDVVVFFCLAFLFIVFASHKKVYISEFLPILCCLLLTSRYVRIRTYLLIVTTPLIFRFLAVMMDEQENKMWKSGGRPTEGFTGKTRRNTILSSVILTVAVVLYTPFVINNPDKVYDTMDLAFIQELREVNPQRLYTSYNDGGLAIYHGFRDFADSRADLFPDDVIDASVSLGTGSENTTERTVQDTLDKWDFDAVLLNRSQHQLCIEVMDLLPGWTRAIESQYYIVFVPKT